MHTCTKTYTDIPFAHRQHAHDGHCAMIHGHNWAFTFVFAAKELDENGFVFDFGKLKLLKDELGALDHALLLNEDDPRLHHLMEQLRSDDPENALARILVVPSASSEGLARRYQEIADRVVARLSDGRARCISCTVTEDSKNYATYSSDPGSTLFGQVITWA